MTLRSPAWTLGLYGDVKVVGLNNPAPGGLALAPVVGEQPYAGVLVGGVSTDYVVEHQSNNGLADVLPLLWQNPVWVFPRWMRPSRPAA